MMRSTHPVGSMAAAPEASDRFSRRPVLTNGTRMGRVAIADVRRQKQGGEGPFTRTRRPAVAEACGLQPITHVFWRHGG